MPGPVTIPSSLSRPRVWFFPRCRPSLGSHEIGVEECLASVQQLMGIQCRQYLLAGVDRVANEGSSISNSIGDTGRQSGADGGNPDGRLLL